MKSKKVDQFQKDEESEYNADSYLAKGLSEQKKKPVPESIKTKDEGEKLPFPTKGVPAVSVKLADLTLEQRLVLGVSKQQLMDLEFKPCDGYIGIRAYSVYKNYQEKIFIMEKCLGKDGEGIYKLRMCGQ